MRFLCSRFGIAIARPIRVRRAKRLFSKYLAKYRAARPDENCHGISTGFCLNFARRAPGRAGLCPPPWPRAAACTSFRKSGPSISTSRTMASTAPSSGARSTLSEPRWCRAIGPPCWRMPAGSFPRMLEADRRRPSPRSTSRCTFSRTTRPERDSPGRSPSGRGRASRCASSSTDSEARSASLAGGAREGGRSGSHLQAPPGLLHRHDRKPHAPPDPDDRRAHRVLRRRRARRPLEGDGARPMIEVEGPGRRPAAAGLRPGLGAYDGRGPQRRSPVPGDRAGGRHGSLR